MPGRNSVVQCVVVSIAGAVMAIAIVCAPTMAAADTLREVLAEVFARNPSVNAARRTVRATRETITEAEAGYKPVVNFEAYKTGTRERVAPPVTLDNRSIRSSALTIVQPVFDGFKTRNAVRQAEANLSGAVDGLRNTTQNTLQTAVQAYVDILRDTAILDLQQKNLGVLTEQVRVTRAQLAAGDVRPSDVSQTEARQAAARAAVSLAQSNLKASQANFNQVVGRPAGHLVEAPSVDRMIPPSLQELLETAYRAHPAIRSARAVVEAAEAQIHINRADLLPKVNLEGLVSDQYDTGIGNNLVTRDTVGQVLGRLTVPIYEGGLNRAKVREAMETL